MDYIISKIGLANTIVFVCCVYSSILYSIVSNKLKNLLSVARGTLAGGALQPLVQRRLSRPGRRKEPRPWLPFGVVRTWGNSRPLFGRMGAGCAGVVAGYCSLFATRP